LVSGIFVVSAVSLAKNRLDLDDIGIKGELHNDDRLVIISRERNEMKNFVHYRSEFRQEMTEVLPTPALGSQRRRK